jgi:hypothetical protein
VIGARTAILLALLTGVALEIGVQAVSGRREAWDSPEFWSIGLPAAGLISVAIGALSRGRAWLGTIFIAPSQVTSMMIRSGEMGPLWPLAVILAGILSAPFVAAAFVGSRFRPRPNEPAHLP